MYGESCGLQLSVGMSYKSDECDAECEVYLFQSMSSEQAVQSNGLALFFPTPLAHGVAIILLLRTRKH